ncbi:hypothetical protein C8J57DRAFT_1566306 [Mycena rebaudengoi]|nr:hypothetical protein C8J57DRAFT_1566306 [Mycena rebaudengoi]
MAARSLYSLLCARPAQIRWRSATAALRVTSPCAAELSGAELRNICRRADNSYYRFRGLPCAPPCALRPTSPAHLRTALRTCAQSPLRTCAPPCALAPNLPAHLRPISPAHLRTALRTCAQPPCAPALRSFPHWCSASRKRSLHAPPCVVALNPLRTCTQLPCAPAPNLPAHLRYATSRIAAPHHLPTCRQLHPRAPCAHSRAPALNICALRTQPPPRCASRPQHRPPRLLRHRPASHQPPPPNRPPTTTCRRSLSHSHPVARQPPARLASRRHACVRLFITIFPTTSTIAETSRPPAPRRPPPRPITSSTT